MPFNSVASGGGDLVSSMNDQIKMALLTSMEPADLQDYIFQWAEVTGGYESTRDRVMSLARNRFLCQSRCLWTSVISSMMIGKKATQRIGLEKTSSESNTWVMEEHATDAADSATLLENARRQKEKAKGS